MTRLIFTSAVAACIASGSCLAQGIPTPGHKCVYNCDAPASSAPSGTGVGAAMGSAIGSAIVKSLSSQGQQNQAPPQPAPDPAQARAARQSLDDWANTGGGPVQNSSGNASPLDQWANGNSAPVAVSTAPASGSPPAHQCAGSIRDGLPASWQCYPPEENGCWIQCADDRAHRRCFQEAEDGTVNEVDCH